MTSHDVVGILRRQLSERRIGHAGTLDPDATGVLVVAVGRSTRLMRFVTGFDKAYSGEVVLGASTSTLDSSGAVVERFDMSAVTLADVRAAAAHLTGAIDQVPPMVSAIKVDGKRLYELARAGEEIERAARRVIVTRLDVEATPDPLVFAVEVECSSGTYVRSLAADVGARLGGGAHLRNLRRTRVGPFTLQGAVDASTASASDLRPPLELVSFMPRVVVDDEDLARVLHGTALAARLIPSDGADDAGPFAVVDAANSLLAVYERDGDAALRPIVVHAAAAGTPGAGAHGRAE